MLGDLFWLVGLTVNSGKVLGLSASSKSLYNMLKCKTSEKEKFHEVASKILREIYVFVKSGFFSGSQKKYACQGTIFSTC